MKEAFKTLSVIFVMAVLLFISISIMIGSENLAEGLFKWEKWGSMITIEMAPVASEEYGTLDFGGLFSYMNNKRPDDFPLTATEVSCAIAKKIRDDFVMFGDIEREENLKAGNIGKVDQTLIAKGEFRLSVKDGKVVTFYNLDNDQIDMLKKMCVETSEYFSGCDKGQISEHCITKMLSYLTFKGEKFCGKEIIVSGKEVVFGNDDCGDEDEDKADKCKDYCSGGDKIKVFKTAGKENVEIDMNKGGNDPYITRDVLKSNQPIPPEGISVQPSYVYTIMWNNKKKAYEIMIYKKPLGVEYGKVSPTDVADDIKKLLDMTVKSETSKVKSFRASPTDVADDIKNLPDTIIKSVIDKAEDFQVSPTNVEDDIKRISDTIIEFEESKVKNFQRSSDAGWKVPELRIVRNVTFTSTKDMEVKDFIDRAIPNEFTKEYVMCGSTANCLTPRDKIKYVKWFQGGMRKIGGSIRPLGENCVDYEDNYVCRKIGKRYKSKLYGLKIDDVYSLDNLWVYLPEYLDPNDKKILEGRTYNVIVNNWFYNHRSSDDWIELSVPGSRLRIDTSVQDISITIVDITEEMGEDQESDLTEKECCQGQGGIYITTVKNGKKTYYCEITIDGEKKKIEASEFFDSHCK